MRYRPALRGESGSGLFRAFLVVLALFGGVD